MKTLSRHSTHLLRAWPWTVNISDITQFVRPSGSIFNYCSVYLWVSKFRVNSYMNCFDFTVHDSAGIFSDPVTHFQWTLSCWIFPKWSKTYLPIYIFIHVCWKPRLELFKRLFRIETKTGAKSFTYHLLWRRTHITHIQIDIK